MRFKIQDLKLKKLIICYPLLSLWLFAVICLIHAVDVYADTPTQQVKQTVDKVLDILKNKELKRPEKTKERRALIRKTVLERFDFEEMAKRSLALHWRNRTPEERKEFVPLYTDLLERSYIKKIESYTDEKILYIGEKIEGEYSEVNTKIVTKRNVEVPIDYKLLRKNGKWEVYDVVIEGVSLVNNYRTQFNKIIRTNSYEELVKRMKNKQEEELFEEKAR
ncbi:toluene tolerance protein [Dissulfurispira thermophila]|uniref:Toluene tolerance protein n=1 Tax=Dissulfurispira thermophila TaxID=2715679 RepID=A0A7G1H387_9BACT|nr:ABC transporter substrate-binding protein [Dissulfurispira thermophila]BCB96406.1 toluene tolerance protein [Dissulfurispira thermophila]